MAEPGKRVFITGGNGFIASQIISALIGQGYHVKTSLRSDDKAQEILKTHPEWKTNLSFAIVSNFLAEGVWDTVFQSEKDGFDYIIHTASPVNFKATDIQKELIDPAVQGTTDLLNSVHKYGGSQVKRFVLLGSSVAVLDSFKDTGSQGPDYTEKDWNPVTAAQAIEANDIMLGYNVSKKLAEQAAWRFLSENSPSFDLTILNPDIVMGPMLQPLSSSKSVNETNAFTTLNFLNGTYKDIDSVRFPFNHFVDVRDVSRAHVLALTNPAASNQRIILVGGVLTPQLVANIIHKNFPELKDRVIKGNPDKPFPDGFDPRNWDTRKSFEIFGTGWSYQTLETSVTDTVRFILEQEKRWKE